MRLIDADELIHIKIDEADPPLSFVPTEFIDAAPTVDPVKNGRWIEHHSVRGVYYSCSNCKAEGYGRYCQNCGAKMTYEDEQNEID